MTQPLSNDLRRRVVTAVDGGLSAAGSGEALWHRAFYGETAVGLRLAANGQLSAQAARRRSGADRTGSRHVPRRSSRWSKRPRT